MIRIITFVGGYDNLFCLCFALPSKGSKYCKTFSRSPIQVIQVTEDQWITHRAKLFLKVRNIDSLPTLISTNVDKRLHLHSVIVGVNEK